MKHKHIITIATIALLIFTSCTDDEFIQSHGYVDLALPSGTLWATTNIGAEYEDIPGDYFSIGDPMVDKEGKENFCKDNYKEDIHKVISYDVKHYGTLNKEYDIATKAWGEKWKTPTYEQFQELFSGDHTIITHNHYQGNGYGTLITSRKNNKTIFIPYAGRRICSACRGSIYYGHRTDLYYLNKSGAYHISTFPPRPWAAKEEWLDTSSYIVISPDVINTTAPSTDEIQKNGLSYTYDDDCFSGCTIRPVTHK